MKKDILLLLSIFFSLEFFNVSLWAEDVSSSFPLLAQEKEEEFDFFDDNEAEEQSRKAREQEEQRAREEEQLKKLEQERKRLEEEKKRREEEASKREKESSLRARSVEEAKKAELNAFREKSADTTEYTIDPSSVELVVELDPNNYGFRTRNHRMTLTGEFDFVLRGRGLLRYDFRFFEYFSLGLMGGVDWTSMSLFDKFRSQMDNTAPAQFTILGGLTARVRLTEWYLHSAIFLEPSFMVGRLWQSLPTEDSEHWRIRPGLFGGIETVFDSGFALTTRIGVEMPFDFAKENPVRETAEPVLMFGFGLAI